MDHCYITWLNSHLLLLRSRMNPRARFDSTPLSVNSTLPARRGATTCPANVHKQQRLSAAVLSAAVSEERWAAGTPRCPPVPAPTLMQPPRQEPAGAANYLLGGFWRPWTQHNSFSLLKWVWQTFKLSSIPGDGYRVSVWFIKSKF